MLIHTSHYFYKLLNNSIMKTLKMIKRWILISIVFVGMSLTAYAVASTVIIRSITLNSVSTTTAEIIVEHIGIEGIYWGIWIDGCDEIYDFGLLFSLFCLLLMFLSFRICFFKFPVVFWITPCANRIKHMLTLSLALKGSNLVMFSI